MGHAPKYPEGAISSLPNQVLGLRPYPPHIVCWVWFYGSKKNPTYGENARLPGNKYQRRPRKGKEKSWSPAPFLSELMRYRDDLVGCGCPAEKGFS